MAVQLFVQDSTTLNWVRLDTRETDPIKLNMSVQSIQQPDVSTSHYTQSFRVPHTSNNGLFFKTAFNVNGYDYDATLKVPAYIMNDGVLFTTGNIRLNAVYADYKNEAYDYDIQFFGETSDFGSAVGDGNLCELDFSDLAHPLSYDNIVASWGATGATTTPYLNGSIRYPLIEWGYNYTDGPSPIPTTPTVSIAGLKSFTGSSNALQIEQMKPVIQAKAIWDKIFSTTDYTYTSDFLNGATFSNLYIVTESASRNILPSSTDIIVAGGEQYLGDDVTTLVNFSTVVSGNAGNFNLTDDSYLLPLGGAVGGTISFTTQFQYVWGNVPVSVTAYLTIKDDTTNTVVYSGSTGVNQFIVRSQPCTVFPATTTVWSTWGPTGPIELPFNFTGVQGDKYKAYLRIDSSKPLYNTSSVACTNTVIPRYINTGTPSILTSRWSINAPDAVAPGSMLPCTTKKKDFLTSIISRFKLVFAPNKDKEKDFIIEPWVEWIREGSDLLDWSAKLDESKDFMIAPMFYTQARESIFQDVEDTDYVNDGYQKDTKYVFGRLKLDSQIQVLEGSKTVTGIFAPTPLDFVGNSNNWLIPHMAKLTPGTETTAAKIEPIQPKLRLLFWNGLQPSPYTWYLKNGGGASAQNQYPLVSSFKDWPSTTSTFDLDWYSSTPVFGATGSTQTTQSISTVFTNYWKEWYDWTYDAYSRTAECYIRLDDKDIYNFNFNDRIFIKNGWWYVTNIESFVIGQVNVCKIKLMKALVPEANIFPGCDAPFNMQFPYVAPGATSIDVSWSSVSTPLFYEVQWKITTDPTYYSLTGSGTLATLTPWSTTDEWNWQVRSVCSSSSSSDFYSGTWSYSGTGATGFSVNWGFTMFAQSGSLDILKNGVSQVSVTSNNSNSFPVTPGDHIEITTVANAQNPLIAQSTLGVVDNGSTIYNNLTSGIPTAGNTFDFYATGEVYITADSYEY